MERAADAGRPKGFAEAIGFEQLGSACLRLDIVERLAARLLALARAGPFALEPDLMAMTGLAGPQLAAVVEALGFERADEGYVRGKIRPYQGMRRPPRRREPAASPFAALRQMLARQ